MFNINYFVKLLTLTKKKYICTFFYAEAREGMDYRSTSGDFPYGMGESYIREAFTKPCL